MNLKRECRQIFILRTSCYLTDYLTRPILRHLFWILLDLEVQSHISTTLCALETRVVSSRKRFISCNLHLAEQPHGIVQRNESWSECSYFLASRYFHPIEFSLLHLLSDVRFLWKIWRWTHLVLATFGIFLLILVLITFTKSSKTLTIQKPVSFVTWQLRCNLYMNTLDYLIEKLSKYEGNVIMYIECRYHTGKKSSCGLKSWLQSIIALKMTWKTE